MGFNGSTKTSFGSTFHVSTKLSHTSFQINWWLGANRFLTYIWYLTCKYCIPYKDRFPSPHTRIGSLSACNALHTIQGSVPYIALHPIQGSVPLYYIASIGSPHPTQGSVPSLPLQGSVPLYRYKPDHTKVITIWLVLLIKVLPTSYVGTLWLVLPRTVILHHTHWLFKG